MALTHIDCFSGPGGICTGLHAAGFETLIAIEVIKSCVDTYAANHPEVHISGMTVIYTHNKTNGGTRLCGKKAASR